MSDPNAHPPSTPLVMGAAHLQDPQQRLAFVVDTVREISRQTDPQVMVSLFRQRARTLYSGDAFLSLSRRDLAAPCYRITRSTRWPEEINPWTQRDRLPVFQGGLLADLLYSDLPSLRRDLVIGPGEPAREYLEGKRSLIALPLFDHGVALNMVIRLSADAACFDDVDLAGAVFEANLFGCATKNLVLAQQLHQAHAELDYEMQRVGRIQRWLLPARLPHIPTLDLAVSYDTASRAGGDYYDFFEWPDGRWGMLIADVSGHGTPAAVVMAMLRTMLHARGKDPAPPSDILGWANQQLAAHVGSNDGTFVTAFFGEYDARRRVLHYASAGHPPPLLLRPGCAVGELSAAQSLPLAVDVNTQFHASKVTLAPRDALLWFTDGVTDAAGAGGDRYGRDRLVDCLRDDLPAARDMIDCINEKLSAFTNGTPIEDDRTLLAMRVR